MAGHPAPIGELRKDFDRLRTVLFERLRTQSSNFNYKGKRKPPPGAEQNPKEEHTPQHTRPPWRMALRMIQLGRNECSFDSGN